MKILILNRDYPRFLADLYGSRPSLSEESYSRQLAVRNASLFGVADFYSHGFSAAGHIAQEIHVNNTWLQSAWARENGIRGIPSLSPSITGGPLDSRLSLAKGYARRVLTPVARRFFPRQISAEETRILAAQIEQMRPDVILNQEMSYVRTRALSGIMRGETNLVGQIASALPIGEKLDRYGLILSSLPNMVEFYRSAGVRAELSPLAFDPRVLDQIDVAGKRDIDVSFVGSLSADHGVRLRLVEGLARHVHLRVWGSGVEQLPTSSPIHGCFQGEAWGAQMYSVLSRSRITINQHIDLAAGYVNNMRLYEATGCGALMIVDRGKNLSDIFEPEREVVTYSSTEECIEAVKRMLSDESARAAIAAAGQKRTLDYHTYARRTLDLSKLLQEL